MPKIPQLNINYLPQVPQASTGPVRAAAGQINQAVAGLVHTLGGIEKGFVDFYEKEQKAKDDLEAMKLDKQIRENIETKTEAYNGLTDFERFDEYLEKDKATLRQETQPKSASPRVMKAYEGMMINAEYMLGKAVRKKKYQVMEEQGLILFRDHIGLAKKEYADEPDPIKRELILNDIELEGKILQKDNFIRPLLIQKELDSFRGEAEKFAVDQADVMADKAIEVDPKKASLDLRESKYLPNLLPKQRQDKIEKAVAATKILENEQEKKAKEAEKLAHDKDDRDVGDLFLKGNYKDAYLLAQASKYLSGDEKRTWGNSIESKVKEKVEQPDPVVEAAEIVRTNDMITRGTLPPSALRNHIITTPRLGRTNKEQYINKLETKLGKEIEDGRKEGYGDIKDIIFPPVKGLSVESLIQTPQQTYAIMGAQMALDSWIDTEIKAQRYPKKNEIRRKAQQLAQDYQVKFKDKIQYLEKEMEQLNLK